MKTVVFRPTNNCNLMCTYCYDKNNHKYDEKSLREISTKTFLQEENVLLESFKKLFEKEHKPRIIFHGGEPLLIKEEVLDDFCSKLLKNNVINFSIQTNGTLISPATISLFKKYDFSVGISLDGCNEVQNGARIYPTGDNSFNTVLNKMKLLQEEDVKFGVIMSISKLHLNRESEIYDFIEKNNLNCNIRGVFQADNKENVAMTNKEFIDFFNRMFDIWFNDEKKVGTRQISEFYNILKSVIVENYREHGCNTSSNCFENFISMDVFSNLYACNRLYGIDEFYYGNLKDSNMMGVDKKINELLNLRNNAIDIKCKSCSILSKCNGGCPAEAYLSKGSIENKSPECLVKQKTLEYVRGKVYE